MDECYESMNIVNGRDEEEWCWNLGILIWRKNLYNNAFI